MEIGQLRDLCQRVPNQGVSLSHIESIRVECSLRLLQNSMKAEAMFFFGKILAIKKDYYLAFSTDRNLYIPSYFYCSQDCVNWFSITRVDDQLLNEAIHIPQPFSGSLISEFQTPSGRLVTEEQRIASVFECLFRNCFLFPRGYLVQTALDFVLQNPMWTGIPIKECSNLSNFRHWVLPEVEKTPLERALSNPALDFTDALVDLKGWRVVETGDPDEVQFRSVVWPGFIFSLRDTEFANCYFGNGIYEGDIFLPLPTPKEAECGECGEQNDPSQEQAASEECQADESQTPATMDELSAYTASEEQPTETYTEQQQDEIPDE